MDLPHLGDHFASSRFLNQCYEVVVISGSMINHRIVPLLHVQGTGAPGVSGRGLKEPLLRLALSAASVTRER
jgi:hypothetical protein